MLILASGCAKPLRVITENRVALDGPISTTGRIETFAPPVADFGPMEAVVVSRICEDAIDRIAIVDLDGLLLNQDLTGPYSLGENPVALLKEKLDQAAADPGVKAVVVRIHTPGGSVTAADIARHELVQFRTRTGLPLVACLMDVATGGGYYAATACDVIVAHPTTITGGIGVILNLYNLRDAMAYFNVISQTIKAGPNIDMGSSANNLSPEARRHLQSLADQFHERFKEVVTQSRPGVAADDPAVFDGRVFSAKEALDKKLIDRIGYVDQAIATAREIGGAPKADAVLYRRPNDPAHSTYAISPNVPLQGSFFPLSIPGLDRTRMPTFLYLWQPEATLERLSGR